jgi:glucose/arabinose dehydrogenase
VIDMVRRLCWLICSLVFVAASSASAATSLTPIGTYSSPVYVTSDPDNPDRLFVVELGGKVQLTTSAGSTTFLDLTGLVKTVDEQGLLSIALAPDFATTGRLYAAYTGNDSGNLHLDEFRAEGDTVPLSSRRQLLTIDHSFAGNHNGGQLQFGPDGYLYWSTGDGGGAGDPLESGQDLTSLLGKILRIDPRASASAPYSIPDDNPFAGAVNDPPGGARDEIWASGLRNPWRFSFDRLTGALLIGDVGQGSWEEVDYAPQSIGGGRGANFGWDCREGMHDFELAGCAGPTFSAPVFEYGHGTGDCSITGGYVARDPNLADLYGRYLYVDLCGGVVRSLVPGLPLASDDQGEALTLGHPSTFGEDACGRLYVASLTNGVVYRLQDAAGGACATRTLSVGIAGDGSGRVTGHGIDCPGDCSEVTYDAARVTLSATPDAGSRFAGWSGACSRTYSCLLAVTADTSATAAFEKLPAAGEPEPPSSGGPGTDPDAQTPSRQTKLRIAARSTRVRSGKRVNIEVFTERCPARVGDQVDVLRDEARTKTVTLGGDCVARLKRRIRRTTAFSASIDAKGDYLPDTAGPLVVRVRRKQARAGRVSSLGSTTDARPVG